MRLITALIALSMTLLVACGADASSTVVKAEPLGNTVSVETLFEDDFSGDWTSRWSLKYVDRKGLAKRVEPFERDGETWIRVSYPEGRVGKGFKFRTEAEPQEHAYLEYQFRFAEDFDWVRGGKLPGLYGGRGNTGRKPPDGTDGWSVRFMWGSGGSGIAYVYHPDQPKRHGEAFSLPGFRFTKGKIHTMGLEVVVNTPGQNDGIIRAWLDGVLVVEVTSMRFRDVPGLLIDGIAFSTIFGGGNQTWAPTKDETIEFGDFALYRVPPSQSTH